MDDAHALVRHAATFENGDGLNLDLVVALSCSEQQFQAYVDNCIKANQKEKEAVIPP